MITKRRPLGFETLEERQLLAADPVVTLDAPDKVMIGESFQLSVAFDNAHATDAGYGPFVDLLVPVNGEDGTGGVGADGITFDTATYLGVPVLTTILTFPDDGGGTGSVDHPYAVDAAGVPLAITGDAGDQLMVMQLPFGSFTADQPAAVITVDMSLSNQADLGQDLNLRARAGFQYGNDALENPASDPSLISDAGTVAGAWTVAEPIEPILIELTKIYIGPEDETATGPNFPRQYTLDVDIADGQTITNLDVTDLLPNNVELLSVDTITPGGSTTTFPATPANAPNNELVVTLPTVTGAVGAGDAQVTFSYYIPLRDADGVLVIDSVTGDDATSPNHAAALGDWDPIDARDPSGTDNASVDEVGPEHVLTPKSIATQKSVAVVNDPGGNGLSPGDVLEYTIEIQISDYFGFENIVLSDVISDGQRFDAGFTPTLQFTEQGVATSAALDAANFTVTDKFTGGVSPVAPLDGTQVIEVRLSDELITRTGNGVALGGLVPVAGTGGADPDEATFDAGATTGTLVFRTIVQEEFTDIFPSGDSSVDEGDELTNDVSIVGDVLAFSDATATGQTEADTSASSISVPAGTLVKSIYALNGNTTLPNPLILSPGDELTYRLQLTLPTSDIEQLAVEDYLPLPVLSAGEVTTFDDTVSAAVPAAGHAKFGPNDTFRTIFGTTPGLSVDAVSNSVTFEYGDFDIVGGTSTEIDILFTVTATDDPFADGLLLTNQARRVQDTTNAGNFVNDAIIQIVLGEPSLQLTKGIVASDNPSASFTAGIGPVAFSPPGTAGYRGIGTIHSDGLTATPINANIEEIDAGDLVTFAIVLENVGSSRVGAFDVQLKDTLPAGFAISGGGLNLTVTDGTGAAIAFSDVAGGLFDAAGGILLSDPGPTTAQPDLTDAGAIDQYNATTGRNIMVLTYDLIVESTAVPNESIVNTATLTNYAGAEGGPDFTTTDLTDVATALITSLDVSKSIIATNHANTTALDVAIGEVVTYRSVITVPEGTAGNITWTDFPDNGLSVIDLVSLTPSSGDLTLGAGTFADVLTAATIGTNGDSISLSFLGLDNANRDDTTAETITIEYRTVVLNRNSNDRGDQLNNLATVTWSLGATATSAPNVTVVEPMLVVGKTIAPTGGEGSNQFLVTLDLSHSGASNADAFNVTLSDVLPTGLSYAGGLTNSGGVVPSTLSENSGTFVATFNELLLTQTSQLQFNVELDQNVPAGTTITNTANSDWSSLPGDITTPQSSDAISTERTGSTGDPGGAVNDYATSASATVTVVAPTLAKSILSTNQAHTAGQDVAIGEIVTYRTVITVPQASHATATLADVPSAGLSIIDVLSVVASKPVVTASTGTMAAVAAAAVIAGDGASVTFDFGTLNNTDTDSSVDETITIEYRAVVLNTAANDRGDTLDNTATFNWASQNVQASAADLTIVEPTLNVDKTIAPTTGQGVDQFTITLDLSHTGTSNADAFNVTLTDALPAGLVFVGSLSSTAGVAPTTIGESGGTITATFAELQIGQTSQIEFTVALDPTVAAGTDITNTVNSDWSSLPGTVTTAQSSNALSTERTGSAADPGGATNDYTDSANATVTVISPTLSKTIIATNQVHTAAHDVAIGEIVTYRTVITVPQATLANVSLVDVPTPGLAILDVFSITGPNTVTSSAGTFAAITSAAVIPADGSSVTFDFGTLSNADTDSVIDEEIVVEYRAVVLNAAANDRGDTLENTATFNWASQNVQASAADLTIVEPNLVVDVSIATPAIADAGDTVQFVLTVSHASDSDADAFDVSLENLIDSVANHLQYVAGPLVESTTGGAVLDALDAIGGDLTATWSEFPLGATATLTFNVILENTAPPLTNLVNDANIEWTSLPTDVDTPQASNPVSVERTGDNTDVGGTANDHNAADSGAVATTAPLSAKTVVSSSLALSGDGEHNPALTDLLINEEVTFSIIATLPEGTSPLVITDQLPTGAAGVIEYLSVSVNSVGASLTLPPSAPTITPSNTDGDTLNDRVVLDFGSVINTADGVVNADDEIEILVTGRIVDVADNANGDVLTNTATIDFGSGQTIATADVEIIEPVLQIDKTGTPITAPAGSTVDYTLVVTHAAGSTSDAFDVGVTDLLADANLTLVPGTVATSVGTITTGNGASDNTIAVGIGDFARGETVTITFTGLVNPDLAGGVAVNNTSDLRWDSLPLGAGRHGTDDDPATLTTSAPEIDLSVSKTDNPDPVTVDDPFSYTVTVVNNGPSTATGVTLVDTLPTVIVNTITQSQGTFILAGNTLTVDVGTLQPGDSASVQIDATAPSTEQTLTNQASVTANENDTDPSNNDVTEPTEVLATATLSGVNWVDIDSDGTIDTDEVTLPGTNLTLTGTDIFGNAVSLDTVSGPNGEYLFDRLRPGDYTVTQHQPTLFIDSDDYFGSVGGSVSGTNAVSVTLSAGDNATNYNFSEAGLRPSGFSKRMLLLSTLQSAASAEEAALDAAFAGLAGLGQGDLDLDGDVDDDDRALFALRLGDVF